MAKIKFRNGSFTGSVGPVRFEDGEASTDLPAMLAHFRRNTERYEVTEDAEADQGGEEPDDQGSGEDPDADGADADPEDSGEAGEDDNEHDPEPRDGDGDGYVHDGTEDEHPAPGSDADPYDVNVQALRKLAGERGIPQAGSKAELQERLRAHDAEHTKSDTEE